MLIRRWLLAMVLTLAALAGPGPAGAAPAGVPTARGPAAPAEGVVGSGTPSSCDEPALEAALAGGGSVTFDCGGPHTILILTPKTITQSTTIDGGDLITITGGLATRLFEVQAGAALNLRYIILDRAAVNGSDGGAISNAGSLSLYYSTIQNSQTDIAHSGGAIFSTGPVSIVRSTLKHNTAGSAGALFANFSDAKVTIEVSDIDHNQGVNPAARGGAIWVGLGAEASIYLSRIGDNFSEGDGGAVYNQGRLTSSVTVYSSNKTTRDPGAGSRGYGGAIASIGPMTSTRDYIFYNKSRFGGGLYVGGTVSETQALVSSSFIQGNEALFGGGGLYTNAGNTTLTVTDSLFRDNHANIGGGLSRSSTNLSIFRSSFGENLANTGGGLASSAGPGPGSPVLVYDSTFYSNVVTTTQGGAIRNEALMDLRNLTLEGNTSGVSNSGVNDVMQMSNSVLHNLGLNCDGDGTKPQSQGGNFAADNTCNLAGIGDAQGLFLDPLLGPISITQEFEGIAAFFMPLPGSPLINTAVVACSQRDQRRAFRPDACDKGAVEYNGLLPRIFLPLALFGP